ncbi:YhcN/YlaJ family sporulation lipoprotein [Sporosarcina sp. YIM B06819]|uniref:YhcN/YlaJ family sporulation lipoprotein n=1 Tax=Sporosarcina sp. YIM B06819 TaxID=3081769 RepID=UPI00298BF4B7|nr:YhcN/YlaJ family sporulation lipoprotein [Sporosarcina sp. YIM B06819]
MKKFSIITASLFLILSLMGCGMNKTKEEIDKVEDKVTGQTGSDVKTNDDVVNKEEKRLEVADEAADRIVKMEEVESANVIVTNHNAYVAVVLHEGVEGTKQIEDKIAEEARAANKDFNNVYVSMNPDFVKQTTDYGNKIRAGEPVEGFFEEFSDTVKRVFPDAH